MIQAYLCKTLYTAILLCLLMVGERFASSAKKRTNTITEDELHVRTHTPCKWDEIVQYLCQFFLLSNIFNFCYLEKLLCILTSIKTIRRLWDIPAQNYMLYTMQKFNHYDRTYITSQNVLLIKNVPCTTMDDWWLPSVHHDLLTTHVLLHTACTVGHYTPEECTVDTCRPEEKSRRPSMLPWPTWGRGVGGIH